MDNLKLNEEILMVKENYMNSLNELKGLSSFFKIFSETYGEELKLFQKRFALHEEQHQIIAESILSNNLSGINNCFKQCNDKTENILFKFQNELINTLEDFCNTQKQIYSDNLNNLRKTFLNYEENKYFLNKAKLNYYKAADISRKEETKQRQIENLLNSGITTDEKEIQKFKEDLDIIIRNKMEAQNFKNLYKYEIGKVNKCANEANEEYEKIKANIKTAEESRIWFIKSSFNKYKTFMNEYMKNIKEYLDIIDNYFSDEICDKLQSFNLKELTKYNDPKKRKNSNPNNTNNANESNLKINRINEEKYVSFEEYLEKNKNSFDSKTVIATTPDSEKIEALALNKLTNIPEKETVNFMNQVISQLLSENEIDYSQIAKLIEILQNDKQISELEKKFIDCLIESKKGNTLKFLNLKNLEHLANCLSYITLKENSIFEGKFLINFKIIFMAEKIFYQNKINNNKVYLSAILSKNKFYRTKLFWKNVMELRLAVKLEDSISIIIQHGEKNKGFFSKISSKLNKDSGLHNLSLISNTRILPLIKGYSQLDDNKLITIDKLATKEMKTIIKNEIPSYSNFNLDSNISFDLISELTKEYKISDEDINYTNFLITYSNVAKHTIRQISPHENDNSNNVFLTEEKKNLQLMNIPNETKFIKILTFCLPFLKYQDYNNVLLLSKGINTKIKKKIYKYVLAQKDITKETRLYIWGNLLKLKEVKKKYDYHKILKEIDDQKCLQEIIKDVKRTAKGNKKIEETKEKIMNILYALSQNNNGIKYCQGMNFIALALYDLYGEEEAFYIFLSFFLNTDYSIIFAKDLKQLKSFFYVFNRIISLLEPELNSYFNSNGVNVSFFLPPWFITLFTSSHRYTRESGDDQIILRILDNFITSGWNAMMGVGCALLHEYENTLINMKYEVMMEFLINDLLKSDFFSNNNLKNLEEYFNKIKISKNLFKNIEAEYVQDSKLNDSSSK